MFNKCYQNFEIVDGGDLKQASARRSEVKCFMPMRLANVTRKAILFRLSF